MRNKYYDVFIIYQTPTSVLDQDKQNFTANLIGQDEVPPTNSKATGNSTLILSSDGMNIKYVKDIDNVITAQIQQGKKGEWALL